MSSINTTADCNGVPAAVTDDILSSRRRCLLVTALAAAGGDAVVEDLAAAVFAAEEGGPTETDPQACDDVARELYENHLPKLTATELVEYDSMLGRVRLTEPALAKLARRELSE